MTIVVRDHEGEIAHGGWEVWDKRDSWVVGVIHHLVFHHLVVVNKVVIRVIVESINPDRWVRHDNWG